MGWGVSRRPKISTKLGRPLNREGSEGDTQIKGTPLGAKLFAKWSGRWWDVPLSINGVTKFGESISNYLSIDTDSIDIIKGSKNVASFGASMRVGEDSTSKSALRIASDGGLTIGQKGSAANFSVAADGTVSISTDDITLTPSAGVIANGDSIIFIDADDSNNTKKDALADLATLFAGAGMTATSSVLNVIGGTGITANANDIALTNTAVTVVAGAGMTGGGSVALGSSTTLNVIAGTGIDVAADAVSVDVSDFMSNGANNYVVTSTGTDAMNAESGLTFDGTYLKIVDDGDVGSSTFASGFAGNGWKIDDDTTVTATFDDLYIRGTMNVYELIIQQIRATNGALFISSAAKVESTTGSLGAGDDIGTITFEPAIANIGPFAANDLILCQQVNPGALVAQDAAGGATSVIKKLVYKITAADPDGDGSDNKYSVENGGYNNTTGPAEGDTFVRIGNTDNAARQGVIYLTSDDSNSPYIDIKADIDSYADWHDEGKIKVRLGKLDGITDTDANLSGSQSEAWGLYSDSVYLKGHIHATSGKIGGWTMDSNAVFYGTEVANDTFTAAGSITLGAGFLGANQFKIASDGTATFKGSITGGSLSIGSGDNILRVDTDGDLWIGDATQGDAPFQVTKAGVATITDILLAGKITITSTGTDNVCIGSWSSGDPDVGDGNIVIGVDAGNALDVNTDNVTLVGKDAGKIITGATGSDAVAIGHQAMAAIAAPEDSTAVGFQAHYRGATSRFNVAIGHKALYGNDASLWARYNVAVGTGAMEDADGDTNAAGGLEYNTAIGHQAMKEVDGGSNNIALGTTSLINVEGDYNIGIGQEAASTLTSGSGNVVIGKAAITSATGDNQLSISSGSGAVTWIKGDSSGHVDLKVKATAIHGGGGAATYFGCNMKIFEGTTAAVSNTTEITHSITNGKKRICMINTMVQNDADPSGSAPADAFMAPGGIYQDEGDEDFEYTTFYDDTKIYIYIESSASDIASNQYVCSIWYTDADIY